MGATWWADVLATRLQISKGAARRIKYAEVFGARTALTGEPLAPRLAHVAAAQARGQIGSEHLRVIARFFEDLSAHLDAHTRYQVEADRADIATGSGPVQLRRPPIGWPCRSTRTAMRPPTPNGPGGATSGSARRAPTA